MRGDKPVMTPVSALLLGAGASRDAQVPVSTEMTAKLAARLNEHPQSRDTQAFNFVYGAMIQHAAARGTDPSVGLDVERVFAAVMLLADRRDLEVTPFVAAWHPAVDAWDRPMLASGFDENVGHAVRQDPERLGSLIAQYVESRVGVGVGETYRSLANAMIGALRQLLQPQDVGYLEPIARASRTPGGLTVATLNYDKSVEMAAHAAGVHADTGIKYWSQARKWNWAASGLRLLKLHGSIDWCWTDEASPGQSLPDARIVETDNPLEEHRRPALVFGQRSKLVASGPFLSLLLEFERLLESATRLIVIGYSFRDDHINEIIRRWLADEPSRTITIVDPSLRPDDLHGGITVRGNIISRAIRNDGRQDFRQDLLRWLNPITQPGQEPPRQRAEIVSQCAEDAIGLLLP
jgi:hypothetical protein